MVLLYNIDLIITVQFILDRNTTTDPGWSFLLESKMW